MDFNTFFNNTKVTPVQCVQDSILDRQGIALYIKREDLIHPDVSGNKWRKLKYNFKQALDQRYNIILTYGGAYSNHLFATAALGKLLKIKTVGLIRGEKTDPLNPTLSFAKSCGMELIYMDRTSYRMKDQSLFFSELPDIYQNAYVIPEGGTNSLAILGCKELAIEIGNKYNHIVIPCGTGGTIAGIVAGSKSEVLGISALKGKNIFEPVIQDLLTDHTIECNYSINYDYHFGGYAKVNSELMEFIKEFKIKTSILLDPVYTGKMLYGVYDLIKKGAFKKGTEILAIHTGGIQGWDGIPESVKKAIFDNCFQL